LSGTTDAKNTTVQLFRAEEPDEFNSTVDPEYSKTVIHDNGTELDNSGIDQENKNWTEGDGCKTRKRK
jgi:hypothetical protein